jgi:serine O-acetyltransferase
MAESAALQTTRIVTRPASEDHPPVSLSSARGVGPKRNFDAVVAELRRSQDVTHNIRHGGVARRLPSRATLSEIVNGIATALFPTHYGQPDLEADSIDQFVHCKLKTTLAQPEEQIRLSLPLSMSGEASALAAAGRIAHDIVEEFASQLPEIRAALVADLRSAHQSDPGAAMMPEILLGYPGMVAIICYRIARALALLGVPLIARLITLIGHSRTGIDIHPGSEIGEGFSVDHGTGIVIGETAIIGRNVHLCQNVTLGANCVHPKQNPFAVRGVARHPVIEDDVVIFAGATLLGRITIGKGTAIGGNVWLTRSVPPGSNITQSQPSGLGTVSGSAPQ